MTQLESGMSFLQVTASMTMKKKKLQLVQSEICMNRRETAHLRLAAVAGADNSYGLIAIFRCGHLAIKAGGAVCLTRCAPGKVMPCFQMNCNKDIPAIHNGTEIC